MLLMLKFLLFLRPTIGAKESSGRKKMHLNFLFIYLEFQTYASFLTVFTPIPPVPFTPAKPFLPTTPSSPSLLSVFHCFITVLCMSMGDYSLE